jgi:hypothetical protein
MAPKSSKDPGAGPVELLKLIGYDLAGRGNFSLPRETFSISKITQLPGKGSG